MYFGSVRFFKQLIIMAVSLLVLIPLFLSIFLGAKNASYENELLTMSQKLDRMESRPSVEELDYQNLYPKMKVPPTENSVFSNDTVYLTFDDGPSERTLEILDILDRYNIKATFFVIGKTDPRSMEIMKQIVDRGHSIGIHSFSHKYTEIYASVSSFLDDFNKEYRLIYEATGTKPEIYRFPGGSINGYNMDCYQEIIAEMSRRGFVYFDWNTSLQDATAKPNPASIIQASQSCSGKYTRIIVLGHDSENKQAVVTALPAIIEKYRYQGYAFDRLTKEDVPVSFSYNE